MASSWLLGFLTKKDYLSIDESILSLGFVSESYPFFKTNFIKNKLFLNLKTKR